MPLHRRLPKRGFHNLFRNEFAVVNLDVLAEAFEAGTVVTPELMRERGLLRGATRPVKVLGAGRSVGRADRPRRQVQRQGRRRRLPPPVARPKRSPPQPAAE